jgi:hypothetical protein
MKKILMFSFLTLVLAVAAEAQITISPITSEGSVRTRGEYMLTNGGLSPVFFMVQVDQIKFDKVAQRPVKVDVAKGDEVKVELSQTSGRISPRETIHISYKVFCPKSEDACQVSLGNIFAAGKMTAANMGVGVRTMLPFTVYLCPDAAKGCRLRTLARAGIVPPEDRESRAPKPAGRQ